ncbi:MAG: hypothetical protein ACREAA_14195 [Candidatus Polarisedimenticolia bacterium]
MRRLPLLAAAAAALLTLAGEAGASSPAVWDYPAPPAPDSKTAETLAPRDGRPAALRIEGRAEGLAVGEAGRLTLSLPLREMFPGASELKAPSQIWTATLDDGGRIHLGAGDGAEVITIDKKGTAAEGIEMDDLGVRALAAGAGGDLFIGTFPNGDIYRMPRGKDPEPWAEMEDRYLWAMVIDPQQRLYVGTGEKGIVYRVTAKNQKEIVFDSDQAHITALAFDPGGRLLAGTDPDGLLYRIGDDGKAELLLDTDLREVSAVTVTPNGVIYAAAVSQEAPPAPRKPGEKSDLMIEVTPAPDGSILEDAGDPPRKIQIDLGELLPAAGRPGEGTLGRVYRIEQGRPPALVWKSDSERVYALGQSKDGTVLFGTGGTGSGRLYRVEPGNGATMLHQVREGQVTAIQGAPDGRTLVGTSNPGRLYSLDATFLSSGNYVSEVYDAGRAARWGSISWDADIPSGARVEISTRSGNRPVPDDSWSPWTPSYAVDRGSAIASPPGRFLQWRAELSRLKNDVMPSLNRVKVTLLPQNLAPSIASLLVMAPGEKAPARQGESPRDPPKTSRWITWDASDPDQDSLRTTVMLRRDGETEFRSLTTEAASPFALDESNLTEGSYLLKVRVDDTLANGPERALQAEAVSYRFVVDRTPPKVEPNKNASRPPAGHLVFEVQAVDALSAIARAEYILGPDDEGKPWLPLSCRDGICDTPAESFLLNLDEGTARGKVRLRVVDTAGNTTIFDPQATPSP